MVSNVMVSLRVSLVVYGYLGSALGLKITTFHRQRTDPSPQLRLSGRGSWGILATISI